MCALLAWVLTAQAITTGSRSSSTTQKETQTFSTTVPIATSTNVEHTKTSGEPTSVEITSAAQGTITQSTTTNKASTTFEPTTTIDGASTAADTRTTRLTTITAVQDTTVEPSTTNEATTTFEPTANSGVMITNSVTFTAVAGVTKTELATTAAEMSTTNDWFP